MKALTVIRHAKSSWDNPGLKDFDRPLKKRGRKDAPLMGGVIKKELTQPDLILCSPSARTTETIEAIIQKTDYSSTLLQFEGELYHADVQMMLYIVSSLEASHNHVFLVAHNPGVTDCLYELTGSEIDKVPTCGVAHIHLHIDYWRDIAAGKGTLQFYDVPKNHKKKG